MTLILKTYASPRRKWLSQWMRQALAWHRERRTQARTVHALEALDARLLDDIGLMRRTDFGRELDARRSAMTIDPLARPVRGFAVMAGRRR